LDSKTIDGSINGYSIEESTPVYIEDASGKLSKINEPTKENPDIRNGNALNIFLNYKTIVQIWKKSYARIDFLAGVLSLINANSYGLFTLVYSPQYEGTPATIICFKSENEAPKPKVLYRFKPTTIKSIVREFSFNFEMSNLVAGRTVFNTQRFLAEAFKKVKPEDRNNNIELPPSVTTSFDNSMFSNADGYYSINYIDLEAAKETFKDMVKKPTQSEPEKEQDETKAKNITEIIDSKSIKFKRGEKDIKLLIYNDLEFIRKQVKSPDAAQKNTLTPIDINIKIDGLSGFSCGEYFNVDGIPEVYNQIGVFQITNTKHSLDKDGWTTTIEAGFRINKK
jgi:hypothetical protein